MLLIIKVNTNAVQLAVTQPKLRNFMEKNKMQDRVKCTAKVKVNGIKLTLKNNWRRNKLKIGYRISCGFCV
jgi:hypothetical protein